MLRVRPKGVLLWLPLLLATALNAAAEPSASSKDDKATGQFLRVARDKDNSPLALETAIVRCIPADGRRRRPTVDLVAAIHIADKGYYEQLNRKFKDYDAVLYELVAPEESVAQRRINPNGNHPVSLLQNGLKDLLGLEFQLKEIDYTRENMVHADMSPDEFAESMQKRGETALTIIMRMVGYAMTRQSESTDNGGGEQLLLALFDKNRALALKRFFAEQFDDSQSSLAALDGPSGSTLISGRNQVALEVLRREIAAGKKKIAIFYGAAHLADFQKRLRAEFGLKPASTRWLTAWNLKP